MAAAPPWLLSTSQRHRPWLGYGLAGLALFLILSLPRAAQAKAPTLFVDQHNPACMDDGSGAGSRTTPFCTIGRAAQVAVAGDIVQVSSGTYEETVTPEHSGNPGARIVFRTAPQATVVIEGSSHGFDIDGRQWIVVRGFIITGTSSNGILIKNSSHVAVRGAHVSYSGRPVDGAIAAGIRLEASSESVISATVTDHNSDAGIYLLNGSTKNRLIRNTAFSNARQFVRAAPGIDVRSPGNVIADNITYDNEDSGIQLYNGANNSVVYDNVTYDNGDHGIDCLNSTGAVIVGNTVYENTTAGINLEGANGTAASTGGRVENNISVDNGLTNTTGTKADIRVDPNSTAGTTLDYDLVWLSRSGTVMVWGNTSYASLAAFVAASGQETHGIEADPRWSAPGSGDFRLTEGSPAIDSADSTAPSEPPVDIVGSPRVDDPATTNTGQGARTYDDRGAYEFQT
jgi:parallel beta-helix repeat protein